MKAAVLHNYCEELQIENVDLEEPRKGEVRVKMKAAGICHSDLHVINAHLPLPVPIILGHEGAGVVDAVGEGVTSVKVGDHVVLNWVPSCGKCYYCQIGRPDMCDEAAKISAMGTMFDGTTRFSIGGKAVYQFPLTGTFSEYTVVPERAAIPIRNDVPFELAALVGCSVITGVGAVTNTAKVEPGSTVAVIGAGGVGFNVIQGAALCGAKQIIAIDVLPEKLEMTKTFGATHTINASEEDVISAVLDLTGGHGVDYAFEVIGRPETMAEAYNITRKTGTAVIVGIAAPNESVTVNAFSLPSQSKTLTGSWLGQGNPPVDYPKLLDLYAEGKLKLEPLVSKIYTLDQINEGFEALKAGKNIRGVIRFD
ncbi:Zn-dependent alcohol dehydrogenase [Parageobacillus thermoglucosidasius]|uniref:Zn-dependent alcohol dehydrogenase n=1 Tax=Parageobacillus thermoglucosidasius TaxID=1426 RepID=A0AB38QWQ7_PARTM|nr:Zn-dependent alcohol dehydrogenase [Parageobacillus thermoglucosidasius]UOE75813.1 Zn-dependent alcohol dehydrogenase [Parageobacillus thermoglucosidasius]